MCGRYANHVTEMRNWAGILRDWPEDVATGYNVSPTQIVPAFTGPAGNGMRWGLVPHWAKDASPGYSTFNARVESVASKPAYRNSWGKSQRCLIPALGYYEWQAVDGRKQPWFIHDAHGDPLVFGGIWERWQRGDEELLSCSIITLPAKRDIAQLHDRMPLMLRPEHAASWLHADAEGAMAMIDAGTIPALVYHPVSTAVNNPRNQGEKLVEPISPG